MSLFTEDSKKVVGIEVLNLETNTSKPVVSYKTTCADGTEEMHRTYVTSLGGYFTGFVPKPIQRAEFLCKVYCGRFRGDVRLLFTATMKDGSVQLLQAKEGSSASLELLKLTSQPAAGETGPGQPYDLKENELPQGAYAVGTQIPQGTYDFLVVYGTGGKFSKAQYDDTGKIIDGTYEFYWVGLKEDYEKRQLLHIACKAGETVKISGNVVLKISRSKDVQLNL